MTLDPRVWLPDPRRWLPDGDRGVTPTEVLPLLIVTLLLLSIGGADVEQMDVTFDGDRDVTAIDDVLAVAGGESIVGPDTTVAGDVYVIGGDVRIDGRLDGDVTVLAGTLTVTEGAAVTGTVDVIAGDATLSPDAAIGAVSRVEAIVPETSPAQRIGAFLLQFSVLAVAGLWLVRRHPRLLENVGDAAVGHPLVSGTIGALAGLTLLVLFVYMAFTIVLLPVSIAGLLGELVVVLYGQVALGYVLGMALPVRDDVATVAGIGAFLLAMETLALVPTMGSLVQLGLLVVGFGAVVNTYFGVARFEPAAIPGSGGK